jgi:hypothetical protein
MECVRFYVRLVIFNGIPEEDGSMTSVHKALKGQQTDIYIYWDSGAS